MTCQVFAHTGSYGSGGKGTGSALATSDTRATSSIDSTIGLETFVFSGADRITLTASANYVLVFVYDAGDSSNRFWLARDASSPTHAGNYVNATTGLGAWDSSSAIDAPFYVYGDVAAPSTSIKQFATIAYASLKQVAGVPIASIKELAGVA